MDYQGNLKIVENLLSKGEILCQLAEEAVELTRATFDFKLTGNNIPHYTRTIPYKMYTDWHQKEWKKLREEAADTLVAMDTVKNIFFSPEEKGIVDSVLVSFSVIADSLPDGEKLNLLIKDALDLSKAALKMRRATGTENPTPITEDEARRTLICCCAALLSAINSVIDENEAVLLEETKIKKAERWSKRLRGEANA